VVTRLIELGAGVTGKIMGDLAQHHPENIQSTKTLRLAYEAQHPVKEPGMD
jgi:hypothetical protein